VLDVPTVVACLPKSAGRNLPVVIVKLQLGCVNTRANVSVWMYRSLTFVHAACCIVHQVDVTERRLEELPMLPYVVGIVLSLAVALCARSVGFDRDRAFYPTVLVVIASYYVLFAAMSGSVRTVLLESLVMTPFVIAAVAGFKGSTWIVIGALAAHGVQDVVHGHIVANAGVPDWWPAWCLAYDVGAASALAWLLLRADMPADAASMASRVSTP
jgi:hypothetical protein